MRITLLNMARQKEFESPTFRLGGERSILLSYWRNSQIVFYSIAVRMSSEL